MATLDLGQVVGESATITVGTTTTLEAGSNATVENVGTSQDAILNFGIPKGADGETESSYSNLNNKPQINSVELNGNKSLSDLGIQPSGNYLISESDPVFTASASYGISSSDITNWNNKSDFSGSYNDLSNKPTIPDSTSDLTNDSGFIDKSVNDLTYYTLAVDTGHSIDLSINSSTYVMTLDLKNSAGTTISTDTVDLPLESMVVSGSYDDNTKKIILTLQSGSTVEFSVADLVSGLQSEITSSNKLSADLVDDSNATNKFVTSTEKTTWGNKYDKPLAGIPKTDLASDIQTSLGKADTALQSETYTGTITGITMNGASKGTSGVVDLGTVITSHQDISGKLDTSKVKNANSTTAGDVYDVRYINSILGDISTVLSSLVTVNNGGGE